MKKIISLAFTVTALATANLSFANKFSLEVDGKPIVRIEVDEGSEFDKSEYRSSQHNRSYDYEAHYLANQRLRERVQLLEQAVVQLQSAVFALESSQQQKNQYVCLLKTTSRGSFYGKGATKLEAEGEARKQCQEKNSEFWCKDSVTCDSNVTE